MYIKAILLSFEFPATFESDPEEVDSVNETELEPDEALTMMNVVRRAYRLIRACIRDTIDPAIQFGVTEFMEMTSFLHVATTVYDDNIVMGNEEVPSTLMLTAKFYQIVSTNDYKVYIDLEQMNALTKDKTLLDPQSYWDRGFDNKQIHALALRLDEKFHLGGGIEHLPVMKRGRTHLPMFMETSDGRALEYDFTKMIYHKRSAYQDIKIVESPSLGRLLILDNLQNMAEVDDSYTHCLMDKGKCSYTDKDILILGGGDGALLYELLKENPKLVVMAEIDAHVIAACREHMRPFGEALAKIEGPNYKIVIDDCRKVMQNYYESGKRFDFIFNDLTDIPVTRREDSLTAFDSSLRQQSNPWHFIESIFNLSLDLLAPGGSYMNHATGKSDLRSIEAYERFLNASVVKVRYTKREAFVPSFMESWTFYTVQKAD